LLSLFRPKIIEELELVVCSDGDTIQIIIIIIIMINTETRSEMAHKRSNIVHTDARQYEESHSGIRRQNE
jgi:hypothetical protein